MPAWSSGKEQKADRSGEKRDATREQDAGDDNHQQVKGDEVAFLQAGGVDQERNHRYIARDLQTAMPPSLGKPPQENEMEDSESDPEDDQRQKKRFVL